MLSACSTGGFIASCPQEHLELARQFYLWPTWIHPLGIWSISLDLKLLHIGECNKKSKASQVERELAPSNKLFPSSPSCQNLWNVKYCLQESQLGSKGCDGAGKRREDLNCRQWQKEGMHSLILKGTVLPFLSCPGGPCNFICHQILTEPPPEH